MESNSLPLSIREAASVNSFKALVRKFFMDYYSIGMFFSRYLIFIIPISINFIFFYIIFFFVPLVFCYNMGSLTLLHFILWLLL